MVCTENFGLFLEEEPLEDTIAAMMEVAKEQVTPFNLTISDEEDDI